MSASPIPEGVAGGGSPSAGVPPQVDTQNERLGDGVNRCPKCGATEIQLRVGTGKLVCLFCRHEWSEARIEPQLAGETPLDQLTGTTVTTGAADRSPEVSGVVTLKCGGCGSEVVVNTAEAMSARCHWCRHVLTINEQVPNGAVPDAVLPFALTREAAVQKISEFAGSREVVGKLLVLGQCLDDRGQFRVTPPDAP